MKICRVKFSNEIIWGDLLENNVRELYLEGDGEEISFRPGLRMMPLKDVELTMPCLPNRLIGIGDNFKHGEGEMKAPVIFEKTLSCLVPNFSTVSVSERYDVWGEPEIGIVIKKALRPGQPFRVEDHVLGFCLINDTTALSRYHQHDTHDAEAKSQAGFCQINSFIKTEFNYPGAFIQGFLNDQIYREGYIRESQWSLEKVLRETADQKSLKPFDIIFTGCPPRVLSKKTFLKDGDRFLVRVEGLGEIQTSYKVVT